MTRRFFAAWMLALFLTIAMSQDASTAQSPTRIKLGTLAPRGSSYHQILQAMGEKWRQTPAGRVTLTIYPDGTQGGEADMVRRMRIGSLQAGMLTATGLSEIDDSVSALQDMPMVFRSLDELDYVREKLRPMLEQRLFDKGFIALFWGDAGWVRFFSKNPIIRPDDLKKAKLFVWTGDNRQVELMKSSGYQPIPLEPADVLPSLQTGLINAVPSIPFYALAGQFFGPAPHMLELNWAPLVGATVVTRKAWEAIAPATREALAKAAAETGAQMKTKARAEGDQAVETMKKRGLIVHPVSPELEAEWRKAVEEYYPKIRGGVVPAPFFDEVQRLLQEYRKNRK